jgi:nucleotide-binding universal stress UspA family protein
MSQTQTIKQQAGRHTSTLLARPLCAVDGSTGGFLGVEQAVEIMGPGGHITLLEVTSGPDRYQSPAILPGRAASVLDRAREIAKAAGVTSTAEVDPADPPARTIVDWAADYSLLTMGAPVTSWLAGAIAASATDAAISQLPTALLIARDTAPRGVASRIVVASDGATGSDELVELAVELAGPGDGHVTLVHAKGHRSRHADHVESQHCALAAALEDRAHVDLRTGKAQTAIVEAAVAADATLIVMGSRGLHGVPAIGSVSRHVMHESHCSVLLIPPLYLAGVGRETALGSFTPAKRLQRARAEAFAVCRNDRHRRDAT